MNSNPLLPMRMICQHSVLKEELSAVVIPSFERRLVSSLSDHRFASNSGIVESKLVWPTGDSARRVVRLTALSADTRDIESPTGL